MVVFIYSVLIAIAFMFFPSPVFSETLKISFAHAMVGISLLLLLINVLVNCFAWGALQKAVKTSTAAILQLYENDKKMFFFLGLSFLFPLISLSLSLPTLYFEIGELRFWYSIWIVFLGLVLTTTLYAIVKVSKYLNPYSVTKFFTDKRYKLDFTTRVDALFEIAMKGIGATNPSLVIESIDNLQNMLCETDWKDQNIKQQLNYENLYTLNLLDLLHEKALDRKLEPVCSKLITTLGKLTLKITQYDPQLGNYPAHFIGKFALAACDAKLMSVAEKATCTLLEVGKSIFQLENVNNLKLDEIYFSIIQSMDKIAKKVFQNDKSINISLLIQPFQDLKNLFEKGKGNSHPNKIFIVGELDRVINQFEQLQLVMRTIPPINLENVES